MFYVVNIVFFMFGYGFGILSCFKIFVKKANLHFYLKKNKTEEDLTVFQLKSFLNSNILELSTELIFQYKTSVVIKLYISKRVLLQKTSKNIIFNCKIICLTHLTHFFIKSDCKWKNTITAIPSKKKLFFVIIQKIVGLWLWDSQVPPVMKYNNFPWTISKRFCSRKN